MWAQETYLWTIPNLATGRTGGAAKKYSRGPKMGTHSDPRNGYLLFTFKRRGPKMGTKYGPRNGHRTETKKGYIPRNGFMESMPVYRFLAQRIQTCKGATHGDYKMIIELGSWTKDMCSAIASDFGACFTRISCQISWSWLPRATVRKLKTLIHAWDMLAQPVQP